MRELISLSRKFTGLFRTLAYHIHACSLNGHIAGLKIKGSDYLSSLDCWLQWWFVLPFGEFSFSLFNLYTFLQCDLFYMMQHFFTMRFLDIILSSLSSSRGQACGVLAGRKVRHRLRMEETWCFLEVKFEMKFHL